VAYWADVTS